MLEKLIVSINPYNIKFHSNDGDKRHGLDINSHFLWIMLFFIWCF